MHELARRGDDAPRLALYRVDLELRPGGSEGPLLVTDSVLAEYYETAAAAWERAAFMKARPIAGDLALGWRAIRGVSPISDS